MPEPNSGCWLWTGAANDRGYGQLRLTEQGVQTSVYAHRIAYEEVHGAIPDDLELDHRCRTPSCVNPAHLEAVTHTENCRRARLDECVHGHAFTPENTYQRKDGLGRQCRRCNADRAARRRDDANV